MSAHPERKSKASRYDAKFHFHHARPASSRGQCARRRMAQASARRRLASSPGARQTRRDHETLTCVLSRCRTTTGQLDLARGKSATGRLASDRRPWQRRAPAPVFRPSAGICIDRVPRFPLHAAHCKAGRFSDAVKLPASRAHSMSVSPRLTPMPTCTRRAAGSAPPTPSRYAQGRDQNPEDSNRSLSWALP